MSETARRQRSWWPSRRAGLWLLVVAAAVLWPVLLDNRYYISIGVVAAIYVLLGVGMNILMGHTGLIHAGYAAFYGLGAYVIAIATTKMSLPYWVAFPSAAVLGALIAVLIGVPAIRVREIYFVLVTLGFGEIFRLVATNLDYTGGPNGLYGISAPEIGGLDLGGAINLYWFVLIAVLVSLFAMHRLSVGRVGRAWNYVRLDETAAQSLGVDPVWGKLEATFLGGMWAALGGAYFAIRQTAVAPSSFTFFDSFIVILVIAIGGLRSLSGIIVGTFAMIVLPELLRPLQEYRFIVFGFAIILMMLFRPEGLLPGRGRKRYQAMADDMAGDLSPAEEGS